MAVSDNDERRGMNDERPASVPFVDHPSPFISYSPPMCLRKLLSAYVTPRWDNKQWRIVPGGNGVDRGEGFVMAAMAVSTHALSSCVFSSAGFGVSAVSRCANASS